MLMPANAAKSQPQNITIIQALSKASFSVIKFKQ